MRIGIDATSLAGAGRHSGIGRYTLSLLNHLALDTDAEFIAYAGEGSQRPRDLHARVRWSPVPAGHFGKGNALVNSLWSFPRLARTDQLDLFHAPTVHPRPSMSAVPRGMPCPLAVTIHDLIPLTYYDKGADRMPLRWRMYYRWNLRAAVAADLLITVSETAQVELRSVLGDSVARRARVIYNGVDTPTSVTKKRDATCPYILFAGSFEARKNLPRFLSAYAHAVAQGLSENLVVLANPASGDRAPVDARVEHSKLADRVRFTHSVSQDQLWELYRGATMVAFPSLAEGFGLPPLEAMACGTPVIASRLAAIREILGDAALLVDPYSEEDMSTAMLNLALDPATRARLSKAGAERIRRYDWQASAAQTFAAYTDAVAKARGVSAAAPSAASRKIA